MLLHSNSVMDRIHGLQPKDTGFKFSTDHMQFWILLWYFSITTDISGNKNPKYDTAY
jgi:hypothetical protein